MASHEVVNNESESEIESSLASHEVVNNDSESEIESSLSSSDEEEVQVYNGLGEAVDLEPNSRKVKNTVDLIKRCGHRCLAVLLLLLVLLMCASSLHTLLVLVIVWTRVQLTINSQVVSTKTSKLSESVGRGTI